MANQYTKARAEGVMPGDEDYPETENQFTKGTRSHHPEEVRARIKAGNIVARLERIVEESDKPEHIIGAGKILLDKAISNLSSVDQTVRNEADTMDEESLMAMLRSIITANPSLLSRLLAEDARSKAPDTQLKAVGE